jgi:hypothetical protein
MGSEDEPAVGGGGPESGRSEGIRGKPEGEGGEVFINRLMVWPDSTEGPRHGGEQESLARVVAPVLAGFALAAVVVIGTASATSSHPAMGAATTCFVGGAVSLIFSMQMLALSRRSERTRLAESVTYEFGLLLLLVGIGLFLWPESWSIASAVGVAAAFSAAVLDVIVTLAVWRGSRSRVR